MPNHSHDLYWMSVDISMLFVTCLFPLYHQNKIKELELLCSLKEIPLDFSDLENVVLALRQVAQNAPTF